MIRASHHRFRLITLFVIAFGSSAQTPGTPEAKRGSMPPGGMPPAALPRPGSVNYVQGQVSAAGQPLALQSVGNFALQPGQSVETAGDGYVEVLLTPGAFIRVGPNSELNLSAVGLADTRINLTRGNALVEIDQLISGTHLEVTLASTSVDMLKKGLYGFTATPADVKVFDGKADVVGMTTHSGVAGKHDQIMIDDNPKLRKSSFDEAQAKQDPLYVWSAARSKAESDQNKTVARNPAGYYPGADGWFWDPYSSFYGFWGPGSFYSPFGFGFDGGFYPGFYHGFYGGFRGGYSRGGGHAFVGVHGNGVGGGFHGGGLHGGGGGHR